MTLTGGRGGALTGASLRAAGRTGREADGWLCAHCGAFSRHVVRRRRGRLSTAGMVLARISRSSRSDQLSMYSMSVADPLLEARTSAVDLPQAGDARA